MAARREVEDGRPFRHERDALRVHEAARRVGQRHVHGDGVRPRKQVFQAQRLFDAGRQLPGTLHRDLRVVTQHVHAEQVRGIGDLDADRAEADDAKDASREFVSDEPLLALLHGRLERVPGQVERTHEVERRADVPRAEEEPGQDQFLDRIRIGARRIEDRNAPLREQGNGDVVGAGARPPDGQHARRDLHGMHVRRTHQDRIGAADLGARLVAIGRQAFEALGEMLFSVRMRNRISPSAARTRA